MNALIPIEHGKKLVDVIPNATGLWLEGTGHVFPVSDTPALLAAIFSQMMLSV